VTPGAILAAVAYFLINYGKNTVKISDLQAVQDQLTKNAQIIDRWHQEQTDADAKRDANLNKVASAINGQRDPIYLVRNTPGKCPVPSSPDKAANQPASGGTTDSGSGGDLRPQINGFELKYETAIANCQAVLDKWPQ
jgi:Tfp pilus assembly protein PilE